MKISSLDHFQVEIPAFGSPTAEALAALSLADFATGSVVDGVDTVQDDAYELSRSSPINGARLPSIGCATERTVAAATSSARQAFEAGGWSRAPLAFRKRALIRLGELIAERARELAILDCIEVGKPLDGALSIDIAEAENTFRWYGEAVDKIYGQIAPTKGLDLILREPIGVLAAITPWNYPAMLIAWKIAPMLAAGNSVVLKPAEQAPSSAVLLARLALEAGIPPGVFNVVVGDGPRTGAALARDMNVDGIGFTGSSATGRAIIALSSEGRIRAVSLECGGKSPAIILQDADVATAVSSSAGSVFYMAGQSCNAVTRLLVHESLLEQVLNGLSNEASKYQPSNPLAASCAVGAIIERQKLDELQSQVDQAVAGGAQLIFGGRRMHESTGGNYYAPTVVANPSSAAGVVRNELFGPILPVQTFSTVDEAIKMANDTDYGLWATVWTQNLDRAIDVGRAIRAGSVIINESFGGDITTPMGGYKNSGLGRDRGIEAMLKHTEVKHLSLQTRW